MGRLGCLNHSFLEIITFLNILFPSPPPFNPKTSTQDMAGAKSMTLFVTLALTCAFSLAYPQYPPPPHYGPAPIHKAPARPYSYAYSVNDDYKGLKFSADEASDGKAVTGSYQVLLPDGRTQNVDYTADHYKGFVADVTYQGHATYPAPAPYHPAPYHPAPPAYRPAPYH